MGGCLAAFRMGLCRPSKEPYWPHVSGVERTAYCWSHNAQGWQQVWDKVNVTLYSSNLICYKLIDIDSFAVFLLPLPSCCHVFRKDFKTVTARLCHLAIDNVVQNNEANRTASQAILGLSPISSLDTAWQMRWGTPKWVIWLPGYWYCELYRNYFSSCCSMYIISPHFSSTTVVTADSLSKHAPLWQRTTMKSALQTAGLLYCSLSSSAFIRKIFPFKRDKKPYAFHIQLSIHTHMIWI